MSETFFETFQLQNIPKTKLSLIPNPSLQLALGFLASIAYVFILSALLVYVARLFGQVLECFYMHV